MASISLRKLNKTFGALTVVHDIDLEIGDKEFVILVGPSGCGKSTTLRMIAGLEEISGGELVIGGEMVNDVPSKDRDIAMVFQNYALYPHMTVYKNMAFGLMLRKAPRDEVDRKVTEAAKILDIEHLLNRRPKALSGGQRQRVALGRAMVRNPQVFLLDEPLSNLDAKLRLETRVELKSLQRNLNVTAIYVTHDQEEAMTLADRMAIFMEGEIVQIGAPAEVFERPATLAVAGFIGSPAMNLVRARFDGASIRIGEAPIPINARVPGPPREIMLGVRPGDIVADRQGLAAEIYVNEPLGETTIVNLKIGTAPVKMRVSGKSLFRDGEQIRVRFHPDRLHVFECDSGRRVEV